MIISQKLEMLIQFLKKIIIFLFSHKKIDMNKRIEAEVEVKVEVEKNVLEEI